ncbi:MAG: hypothetical protein UHS32_04395, partial [Bacteroidaceae bacterium]|nr:hypothetical protein [Bacteroidaceae bacterium]
LICLLHSCPQLGLQCIREAHDQRRKPHSLNAILRHTARHPEHTQSHPVSVRGQGQERLAVR